MCYPFARPSANELTVDTLNLWKENLPEFDHGAIGAKYKGINKEPMDPGVPPVGQRRPRLRSGSRTCGMSS
jgi:hypothetical protein